MLILFRSCALKRKPKGSVTKQERSGQLQPSTLTSPRAEEFLVVPPPPPQHIASQQEKYQQLLLGRKFRVPEGATQDEPLFALYRIYEYMLADRTTWYRNAIEAFWRQRHWAVKEIPDPKDADPARYAFLAAITQLLVLAFNANIKQGIAREAPAILTEEEVEELRNRSEHDKIYERIPEWANRVDALIEPLDLRTQQHVEYDSVEDSDDEETELDLCFKEKNILVKPYHIYFT